LIVAQKHRLSQRWTATGGPTVSDATPTPLVTRNDSSVVSKRPFQFSMRRTLLAMAWFCLTAWLAAKAWWFASHKLNDEIFGLYAALAIIAAVASFGVGVGTITGDIYDAVIGVGWIIFLSMIAIMLVARLCALF
jgi:hypothetical protein